MTPAGTVAVIGAGPVGQSAALFLARWNIRTIVVDARPERDVIGSRAICQQRDVLDIWDSVGAGSQIAAEGVTWTRSRTFYEDRELFATEFHDSGRSRFPPFVNISQTRTEVILDECISNSPLIDVLWNHEVVDLDQDANGVVITCKTPEEVKEIRADFAIAAPGSKGESIREMLGVSFDGKSFDDKFLICDIETELSGWEQERRFYFNPAWNPGRQVLIHPCPDSTFRIDWQVPPEFDLESETASGGLDRRIRQIIGERDYSIAWKSVYRFHSRIADRMRVGRILLAGDAAHLFAPFGARGLNSGVLDAENAAWKLAFVLNGWATQDLIETYHIERHSAAEENLEVTSATMDFLVPMDEASWSERARILDLAKEDPSIRAKVDSGRLAEPFWYVDSPLTLPCQRRPFSGRPPKGDVPPPGPGILAPDCPVVLSGRPDVVRLRQLLREGVTLLTGDAIKAGPIKALLGMHPVPLALYSMEELAQTEPISDMLGAKPDEVWVFRPDAHVSAVLDSPTAQVLDRAISELFLLSKN